MSEEELKKISRLEASFYLRLARRKADPKTRARIIYEASGLLDIQDTEIRAAKWLKSRHRPIQIGAEEHSVIMAELDRLDLEKLAELSASFPWPRPIQQEQEAK